jgi:hypothetical protein
MKMYDSISFLVYSGVGSGFTVKENMGRTNPIMQPKGPARDPIVEARDLSWSPNQRIAILVGACTMNVHPIPAIVYPPITNQNPLSPEFTSILNHPPEMKHSEAIMVGATIPNFSNV